MSWNNNNRGHACLWFFEKWKQEQTKVKFTPTGEWSTDFLIKASAGESAAMRMEKALTHATMLDGVFINLYNATYEKGVTSALAIEAMAEVLFDSSKKLKDLGDPVDNAYRFIGEVR